MLAALLLVAGARSAEPEKLRGLLGAIVGFELEVVAWRPTLKLHQKAPLHEREREDLALHVERCAERYGAVQAELGVLRQQLRRVELALYGVIAAVLALGGTAELLPVLRALAPGAAP